MKMNVYVKLLMVVFLASCGKTEFRSSSSSSDPSNLPKKSEKEKEENVFNFEKVHLGDEQALEFVLANEANTPVKPSDIEFLGGGGGGVPFIS